jgi:hypothetical protein
LEEQLWSHYADLDWGSDKITLRPFLLCHSTALSEWIFRSLFHSSFITTAEASSALIFVLPAHLAHVSNNSGFSRHRPNLLLGEVAFHRIMIWAQDVEVCHFSSLYSLKSRKPTAPVRIGRLPQFHSYDNDHDQPSAI